MGHVVHWEITGKDHDELKKFYGDVFGWQLQTMEMDGSPYTTTGPAEGEGGIGGGIAQSDDPNAQGVVFYIAVEDTDEFLKKVEQAGGKTIVPTTTVPNIVTFAQFVDPQGNRIGLVNQEMPS
jgi:predicted enzyme related to lactoylglutathione lyase